MIYFLARLVLFARDLIVIWWQLERKPEGVGGSRAAKQ
jgi:hypothetical protein